MLLPTPVADSVLSSVAPVAAENRSPITSAEPISARDRAIARFLPSLTDVAFLLPIIFIFVKLSGARTLLGDGDTGWHVRTGEWILANGRVPVSDMFSFSRPGAPWFAWEWLWDVAAAFLHQHWGMAAVVLASLLILCLSAALLFRLVRRACDNGFVAIAVTLLATGGCAIHWLARPHLFTLLFLTATLHITSRARDGRTSLLAWLVPMTVLWTNLHGGFFVVFLVLLCYLGSDLLNALLEKNGDIRRQYLMATKPWLMVFAACAAATFINPYGWNLHKHVVDYILDPYQLLHINEFQSVNFHSPVVVYFEPLMLIAVGIAFLDMRQRRFTDVFMTLGFLHLSLIAQRNIPLFCIAAAPVAARWLTVGLRAASESMLAPWFAGVARKFRNFTEGFEETDRLDRVFLVSALAFVLVGAALLRTPPAAGVYDNKFVSTYDPKSYPEKALSLLRAPETKHIFAEDEWGDYLIYNLYPQKKVFVDGRSDFYGDTFGEKYLDLMSVRYGWEKTLDKYAIDTILLSPKFALSSTLKISRDWRVVYDDGTSIVFRRNVPVQSSLVTSNEGIHRNRAIAETNNSDLSITQTNRGDLQITEKPQPGTQKSAGKTT